MSALLKILVIKDIHKGMMRTAFSKKIGLQTGKTGVSLVFALIFCAISACSNVHKSSVIEIVEIYEAIRGASGKQNLSAFAKTVKYIPLETNEDCLIDRIRNLHLTSEYILVATYGECYLFDRDNGKFVRKIGASGDGPNEYRGIRDVAIDEKRGLIYILSNENLRLVCYKFDGEPVMHITNFNNEFFQKFELIAPETYIAYFPNPFGVETRRLVIGNFTDDQQTVIPNFSFFVQEQVPGRSFMLQINALAQFYHFNDQLHFKECLNDTIFTIDDFQLFPKYILNLQSLKFPNSLRGVGLRDFMQMQNRYVICNLVNENSTHLFISAEYDNKIYSIVFDKNTGITGVVDAIDKSEPLHFFGLQDDISIVKMPFWPRYVNPIGEMVAWYDAFDFIEYCEKNNLVALPNISEEDNPIIVIAK